MSSSRLNLSGFCLNTAMFPIFPPLLDCNICSSLSAVILTKKSGITGRLGSVRVGKSEVGKVEIKLETSWLFETAMKAFQLHFPTAVRNLT